MKNGLEDVRRYLLPKEKLLSYLTGLSQNESFIFSYKLSLFVATDKRILFYTKLSVDTEVIEEYYYHNVENIYITVQNLFGYNILPNLTFIYNGESVETKWVHDGSVESFIKVVRQQISKTK